MKTQWNASLDQIGDLIEAVGSTLVRCQYFSPDCMDWATRIVGGVPACDHHADHPSLKFVTCHPHPQVKLLNAYLALGLPRYGGRLYRGVVRARGGKFILQTDFHQLTMCKTEGGELHSPWVTLVGHTVHVDGDILPPGNSLLVKNIATVNA